MRVALYARVSTEEQARHGVSIEAQVEALRKWATEQGHEIVGEYVDAGISGKKPYQKRPELLRFMQALDAGLKVDALVFCKLDRFFRSVKLYYQAMDVLDRHHVAWQTIQENHETVSAEGQFRVNLLMSLAEMEVARTSERIKAVFDHKVIMGEAITGALPLGFKIENKRIVPDENADAARAVFEHYAAHGNKQAARDMLQERFGISLPHLTISHMLQNPLYKGQYRDNADYCEPIVPAELFDRVQIDLARRSTWKPPSGRVYLFAGLLVCAECGRRLTVCTSGGKRTRYRCPQHYMMKTCDHSSSIRESVIETQLLDYLADQVADQEVKIAPKQKKPRINRAAIEGKLTRLKELYIDGDITKEKYTAERDRLTAMLSEKQEQPTKPKIVLGRDFIKNYVDIPQERKKAFWREIIDHIDVDTENHLYIYFR